MNVIITTKYIVQAKYIASRFKKVGVKVNYEPYVGKQMIILLKVERVHVSEMCIHIEKDRTHVTVRIDRKYVTDVSCHA